VVTDVLLWTASCAFCATRTNSTQRYCSVQAIINWLSIWCFSQELDLDASLSDAISQFDWPRRRSKPVKRMERIQF